MAIKKDYKDASLKTRYKDKVRRQTLTKIVVEAEEKRSRAELLDMVEELFEGQKKRLDFEDLRAMIHMLVKSVANSTDDDTGATSAQVSAINANTAKTSFPGFGTSSGRALEGNTALLQLGTTSTTALAGDTTTITTSQANAITANTAKVSQGLTTANTSMEFDVKGTPKTGYSLNIIVTCNDGIKRSTALTLR